MTVRPRHTLELVLRYLRRFERLPNTTDSLIVTNANDEYIGLLPLTRLLTTDPSVTVREVMVTDVPPIPATASDTEVARLFAEQDLVGTPTRTCSRRSRAPRAAGPCGWASTWPPHSWPPL